MYLCGMKKFLYFSLGLLAFIIALYLILILLGIASMAA